MTARPILAVTPNPAADKTVVLSGITPGAVHRVHESHLDPAGKGVNAARMAHRFGSAVLALGFLGGDIGRLVERALEDEGVPSSFRWIAGQTRLNVNLFDPLTRQGTSFYEDGPPVCPEGLVAFRADVQARLRGAAVLVLAGSLLPGMPPSFYAELIGAARQLGVPAIVDADGEPLRLALAARPTLAKPNRAEAGSLLGRQLDTRAAVVEAAGELVARGVGGVVISLGADGAIAADGEGVWLASPPPVELRSTVGSGDSMVAGLAVALARGRRLEDGLRLGTAAGAATAMVPGTALGSAEQVETLLPRVCLERLA